MFPSSHQGISLIVMGQQRLRESVCDVCVCRVALEVKDAEAVERKRITFVLKPIILLQLP